VNPRIEDIQIEEFNLSLMGMRLTNNTRILQLERSMKVHGQLQPVIARLHEGGIQLIDGYKRLSAAEILVMDTLECRLLEVDEQQAKILMLGYNRSNQTMETWEEALILRDLLEKHDVDHRQLAKLTGHSRSWVSRRLSLISKVDQEVSSLIRMGALTSSHARALMRLPRGNQMDIARIMMSLGLSTRVSDRLIDAFLEAEDASEQQQILDHPKPVLWDQTELFEPLYDDRLSCYGNDLMLSLVNFLRPVRSLLVQLENPGIEGLKETERMIIDPFLRKVSGYTERLSRVTGPLQIHKPKQQQDER
jgi:ParB/RepB/Spo0J family partition protein